MALQRTSEEKDRMRRLTTNAATQLPQNAEEQISRATRERMSTPESY